MTLFWEGKTREEWVGNCYSCISIAFLTASAFHRSDQVMKIFYKVTYEKTDQLAESVTYSFESVKTIKGNKIP